METSDNAYRYGGKEWISFRGLNAYDFTARLYDPSLGRFHNPDPLNASYPHLSPYLYCAANPINATDPSGMRINFLKICKFDEASGMDFTEQIMNDLIEFSGLSLFIDNNGFIEYVRDNNGNPVISTIELDGNYTLQGSPTARELLMDKINISDELEVSGGKSSRAEPCSNRIGLNIKQINEHIAGTVGIDNRTLGFGMTFLHELLHTNGTDYDDIIGKFGTGKTVDTVNKIRGELNNLNYDFGIRKNYEAIIINKSNAIIPFDKKSFESVKRGYFPPKGSKYIQIKIK